VIPTWTELLVQTYQSQLLDVEPAWLNKMVRFDFSDKLKGDPETMALIRDRGRGRPCVSATRAASRLGSARGRPERPNNPANLLTVNANNQAPLSNMTGGGSDVAP
jgi:hypothetical protein